MEDTMLETLCFEKTGEKEEYCVTGPGNVSDADIVIPSTYNGLPVTSIGEDAFEDCGSLMSIEIPNSVTEIGDGAFYNCSNLTSVVIPNSVTSIGYFAFRYCSSLTNIEVDKNNNHYQSIDGSLYSKDGKTLVQYAIGKTNPTFIIPNSVTSIGDSAFDNCESLTSVEIPDSVTSIGDSAFEDCSSLMSIEIPNSVTSIGDWAFEGCSSLTIYCEAESAPEGWDEDWNPDNCSVEWGFTGKEIIDEGIEWEQVGATIVITGYKGASKEVKIPKTINTYPVTSIGDWAFADCSSLTSVVIPHSVTSIGYGVFTNCNSLTSIGVDKNNSHYQSIDGSLYSKDGKTLVQYAIGKTNPTFIIPNSVTSIGKCAFRYGRRLKSIAIPNSVTSIGASAFSGCHSLTIYCKAKSAPEGWDEDWNPDNCSVEWGFTGKEIIDKGIEWEQEGDTIVITGYKGTRKEVKIPKTINNYPVTSIGERAFSDCNSLTSVVIPNSVTEIGDDAFYNCSRLKSIAIPNSVTEIGDGAFAYCSSLTSIAIPNSVTSIGHDAFLDCSSLKSIAIPNSVTSIGDWAFADCSSLKSIAIPKSVTCIGDWAFYNCSKVTSIAIPNGVTSIGDWAFADCSSLKSIAIPKSVTCIGDWEFSRCKSLTSVVIPNSVTSIGENAFSGCFSLTIYCEAESQPSGWNSNWNPDSRPVEWGYKGK